MTAPDPYWPPTLDALKVDARINDSRDDARLSMELEAAAEYVQGVRGDRIDFTGPPADGSTLGPVTATLRLGTIRLALRWHARGRSPDGMIASPDVGSVRVSSGDSDIDRMLRIGRYALPVLQPETPPVRTWPGAVSYW